MRTKKALKNVLGSFALQAITNLAGFILPRLMITTYGSMINGLIYSIRQILKYLNLLELGLSSASAVELYRPLAEKDDAKTSRILSSTAQLYKHVGIGFSIGVIAIAVIYPLLVDIGELPWLYVSLLVLMLGFSGAVGFFFAASYRVLLMADQRSYILSIIGAIVGIASLGIMIFAIVRGFDVIIIPVISSAAAVTTIFLLHIVFRRIYGTRLSLKLPPDKKLLPQRGAIITDQLSLMTEKSSPAIIASIVLGLTSASVLSVYNMVFLALESIVKTTPRSLAASFGELGSLGNRAATQNAFSEYEFLYFVFIGWVYTCTSILLLPFITVYTQGIVDANYRQPIVGAMLIAIGILQQIKQPSATLIAANGKFREIRRNSIQAGIIAVCAGVVGALSFGLAGMLFGFVMSSAYRSYFIITYNYKNLLEKSLRGHVFRILLNLTLAIISFLSFTTWTQVQTDGLWRWFASAFQVGIWVALVFACGNIVFDLSNAKRCWARICNLVVRNRG